MAYFIEFSQNPDEAFYQEFVMINRNDGTLLPGTGVNHCWNIYGAGYDDYDFRAVPNVQTVASSQNGMITIPAPGVVAVNIPPSSFASFSADVESGVWSGGHRTRRAVRFRFLAAPTDPSLTKTIAHGTITFGDRMMPSPRIQLEAYPLYPAPAVPTVNATQVKIQLAKVQGNYDAVEAAMPGPTDPATITWETGGPVTLGGPLSNVVAGALGYDDVAMTIFLNAAAANPT